MTIRELLTQVLKDDMTGEQMDDFIKVKKMTPEEAEAYIGRQRQMFEGYAVDFIILVHDFRERQDAHKDWDINRTFRDLAQMRLNIDYMEHFLVRMVGAQEWLG